MNNKSQNSQNSKPSKPLVTDGVFIRLTGTEVCRKVFFKDILYIIRSGDYIDIHTATFEKPFRIKNAICTLEERLVERGFMKIHRSHIVNLWKVEEISKDFITIGGKHISISPALFAEIWEKLIVLDNKWR